MEIYGEYDVVVVGGGTAGVSAAISAARAGANTIVIERFGVLGGQMNVSGPPGFAYCHLWNDSGEKCLAGIIEETHHRLEKEGHAMAYPKSGEGSAWTYAFIDPDWWGLMIFQMMTENKVNLLLHSLAVGVVKEGDTVKGVIVENTSGRQVVLGKVVIDCSGEGDIASRAGAPYEKVSKDKFELEPPSISFTMDGIDWDKFVKYGNQHPEDLIADYQEDLKKQNLAILKKAKTVMDLVPMGSITFHRLTVKAIEAGDYHKFGDLGFFFTPREGGKIQAIFQHSSQVYQCDATDVRELTAGEVEARRQVVIALKAARKYIPGFENAYLTRITSYLRIRETRRIVCDYQMTLADVRAAKKHKDVIGKSVMTMGSHHVATIDTLAFVGEELVKIKDSGSFDLSYRMLVPKNVENLLVAGKMVYTERDCYLRFLPETMVTGQAAGVAAAVCVKKGVTPRQLEKDIKPVQDILVKQGAILFGTR